MDGLGVTFFGVRGSTPCSDPSVARYGGNTACVVLNIPDHDPILFDLGTGLRVYGASLPRGTAFSGTCLLSHLHWDHLQGLAFFAPILCSGGSLQVYGPRPDNAPSLRAAMDVAIAPPMFPVSISALPGTVEYSEVDDSVFQIGDVEVVSRLVPHIGATCGYRVTWNGISVAYISDHQQPGVDVYEASEGVLELCRGVDLLIHDAQYTRDEFAHRHDWGHCTVDYAVWLAEHAEVRQLALFHHDPLHTDDVIDEIVAAYAGSRVKVFAASDGLTVELGVAHAPHR